MNASAVSSGIEIPVDAFLINSHLIHSLNENIEIFFSLASAHELAGLGNKKVYCSNGLVVGVNLHVVCLDILRPVGYENRSVEIFYDIFLMLFSDILTVIGLKLPLNICFLQDINNIMMLDPGELSIDDSIELIL